MIQTMDDGGVRNIYLLFIPLQYWKDITQDSHIYGLMILHTLRAPFTSGRVFE
jgi:hypothetical protein